MKQLEAFVACAQEAFGEAAAPVVMVAKGLEEHAADPSSAVRLGLETATLLRTLGAGPDAQSAGLALGLSHDQRDALELPDEVAALCEGVERLQCIKWDRLEQEATESLRKMFLAMASDLRVVLIALAARVYQVRQLHQQPEQDRKRIATETMEIYAPLANRLGIWQLKWELEDLAFKALERDTYQEIKTLLAQKRDARTKAITTVIELLRNKLDAAGIEANVVGRPKHIYSIYKKMQRKRVGFDEIYDVAAVRVVVDEVEQCYAALGLVHASWTPIGGEFDDYIARPKENFYRSLHTAVFGPDGRPLEVQIRTQQMHEYNEFGVAAHWRYKEAKKADRRFDEKINWVRQLMQWQKGVTDPHEVAQSLRTDIFADQVYVFTPTGDVIDLPQGATAIDFAYRIHTQVGHHCRGAKVGGHIVPLDYALRTGDHVEIMTVKSGGPSRDWLSPHTGLVHTSSARQKIRQYFRQQQREQSVAQGRELIERESKRLGLASHSLDMVLGLYPNYDHAEDLLAAVGFGDISRESLGARLLELEPKAPPAELPVEPEGSKAQVKPARSTSVSVAGIDDVMSQPARCCTPVPGDEVFGFITRGRGLVIHRADCPNYLHHKEPERWMPLSWGNTAGEAYSVAIRVETHNKRQLLRDLTEQLALASIDMESATTRDGADDLAVIQVTLRIHNSSQLLRLLGKLGRLPHVVSARRLSR